MDKPRKDLTQGSVIRNIWYLALPMMASSILQNTFSIVDMKFVGKLGPSAIAAVSMSGIVMGILFVVIIGIYMGTIALVARFVGAKQLEKAEDVAMQSLILGAFCYTIVVIICYPLAASILRALGADKDVIQQGVGYIKIVFLGSFTMILSVVFGSVLRAAGDAITPLKIMVVSTAINIALDPLLIFGYWGFPRLGVAGSALATVIARGVGTVILSWIFLTGRAVVKLRIRDLKVDFSMMWRITRLGIFASLQAIMRNVSGLVLTPIVARYGTFAIAASGIGMRLQMVVMMPAFGLATAVSTLVGQNLGAGKPERAERSAWITAGVGAAIMTLFGIIFIIFAQNVITFFDDDSELVRIGVEYMYIIAGTFGFVGIAIILSRALNGAGDTISPMVITAIGFVGLRITLSILLSSSFGLRGVWFGIAVSSVIQGLMVAYWFNTGRWKHKQV